MRGAVLDDLRDCNLWPAGVEWTVRISEVSGERFDFHLL